MRALKDHPRLATVLAGALVAAHYVAHRWWIVPRLPDEMLESSNAWSYYAGCAGLVALVGSFSGVVVVFGLTPGNSVLKRARRRGGPELRANWVTLVSTPLLAAGILVLAAGMALAGKPVAAGWTFEMGIVLTIVVALRLVWIFRRLVNMDLDKPARKQASGLALVEKAQARQRRA